MILLKYLHSGGDDDDDDDDDAIFKFCSIYNEGIISKYTICCYITISQQSTANKGIYYLKHISIMMTTIELHIPSDVENCLIHFLSTISIALFQIMILFQMKNKMLSDVMMMMMMLMMSVMH